LRSVNRGLTTAGYLTTTTAASGVFTFGKMPGGAGKGGLARLCFPNAF
jgi:hypothetical protein